MPVVADGSDGPPALMEDPDFLIVGGGTAGAVLAARLSEDSATRVLLVEAGDDTPPEAVPTDIVDTFPRSSLNPAYLWPALAATRRKGERPRPFAQARVMGGGSSVMGLWTLRGLPGDYDAWAHRLEDVGMPNSGPVDRFYFRSLYFREPNGILFEIASDGPGFATDEPMDKLGETLALPPFLEPRRAEIEAGLKPV